MALLTGLFNLYPGVASGDSGVAFNAFYPFRHDIGEVFFLSEGLSLDEPDLEIVAFHTV
jgi:hypothetical protein